MKNFVGTIAVFAAVGAGVSLGIDAAEWLWNEVIEDKADKMKKNLEKKFAKKEVEEA